MTAIEDFEKNQRKVSQIHLEMLLADEVSSIDSLLKILKPFAKMCPLLGGDAVYQARALYAAARPGLVFDDMDLCSNRGNGRSVEAKPSFTFEIAPNPSQGSFNLLLPEAQSAICQILSSAGVLVKELHVEKQRTLINLPSPAAGLYFVRVIYEDGRSSISNLVITE